MDDVVLINAKGDGRIELWAVGAPSVRGLEILRQHLPPGWMVSLTGEGLTFKEAAVLDIRPNEVRKLRVFSEESGRTGARRFENIHRHAPEP